MAWGFLGKGPSQSDLNRSEYAKQLRKKTGQRSDSVTDEYILRTGEKQVLAQEIAKQRAKNISNKAKSWNKPTKKQSFKQLLNNVGRSQQQFARQAPPPRERYVRESPNNFFEHKDEVEVYGDEGLTFFDSNKRRGGRTGSLFGI